MNMYSYKDKSKYRKLCTPNLIWGYHFSCTVSHGLLKLLSFMYHGRWTFVILYCLKTIWAAQIVVVQKFQQHPSRERFSGIHGLYIEYCWWLREGYSFLFSRTFLEMKRTKITENNICACFNCCSLFMVL